MSDRCPVCGRWDNRAAVVDGILVEGGRILLVRRGREPFRGLYAIPGGYMDRDETAVEALRREFREETGLEIEAGEFLGFYDDPRRDTRQNVSLTFAVRRTGGELRPGDDADAVLWADLGDLPPLAFDHDRVIADYRARRGRGV